METPWEQAIKNIYPGAFIERKERSGFYVVNIYIGHPQGLYQGPSAFTRNAAWVHAYNELFPNNPITLSAVEREYC